MSVEQEAGRRMRQTRAELIAIRADTASEVERLLDLTQERAAALLAGQPTEWQQWYLPRLRRQVEAIAGDAGGEAGRAAAMGMEAAFGAGVALVDGPLAAAGIAMGLIVPSLDRGQLLAMQSMLTHKMVGVSAVLANRINQELGLVATGINTPSQAADAIERLVDGGRRRALTVVNTELNRAFSTATQQRMEQAVEGGLDDVKKQWRRSGKIRSRWCHDLADGQVRPVREPFLVCGVRMLYPHDPAAPPSQTINCGCTSLPWCADWEMLHPGEVPFSDQERAANPGKLKVEAARAEGFRQWAAATLDGRRKSNGEWRTLGTLSLPVVDFLRGRGIDPATVEVAVSDKLLRRPARPVKAAWDKALPRESLVGLSEVIDRPKAVFWGAEDRALHYLFEIPGESRLGRVVVRVAAEERRSELLRHNYMVSGGVIDREALLDRKRYIAVTGAI